MRFPHPDFSELCLFAQNPDILIRALGSYAYEGEPQMIRDYCANGLPPVTSVPALSTMTGFNPGFIWSILSRPERHYRTFPVPKGKGVPPRLINAPKVGLKAIQSWLSVHWMRRYEHHERSFGFVPGRSHAHAAKMHLGAAWVISVDIQDFFPSISRDRVSAALLELGYRDDEGLDILSRLACLGDVLSQGSPTSPVLSNIVLRQLDDRLQALSVKYEAVFTRYADDIVFSGSGGRPDALLDEVAREVASDGWVIAEDKIYSAVFPQRLKVHGLLVHGDSIRLTKGYRNRIRAFRHLLAQDKIVNEDLPYVLGHISYADFVDGLQ